MTAQQILDLFLIFLLLLPKTSIAMALLEAEWTNLPQSQRIFPRRSGHTAFSASAKHPTFVFGGYIEQDSDKQGDPPLRQVINDLWKYDAATDHHGWIKQEPSGDIPGPRLVAASAVVNSKAYLIGGWDPETEGTGGSILESVSCLDLDSLQWKELKNFPDGPTSRHIALVLPGAKPKILIHNHRCTGHVWIFDPETESYTQQPTTGQSPGSLGLHAATMLDDTHVLLFGGATKDGTMSNQSHVLNTETWEWKQVVLGKDADCPSPRAGACLVAHNGKYGILFGGAETTDAGLNPKGDVWALQVVDDLDQECTGRWSMLLNEKQGEAFPEPRNAATLSPFDEGQNMDNSKFLLAGGWAPFRRTWDDVFILSIRHSS